MDTIVATIKDLDMSDLQLPLITLYNHPKDYPDKIVARIWEGRTAQPTNAVILYDSIPDAKNDLRAFTRLERRPEDDPCIICTYLP